MYANFEEVVALDDDAVSDLLESGDQTERVWAAWVFGLRSAGQLRDGLSERLEGEPTRGVRQHLLIVLASVGAIEPIAALAVSDPSDEVRASAARLLGRLVGPERPSNIAVAERLAAHAAREPSLEVRAALISEVRADAPSALIELVDRAVRADHLPLRVAAARAMLRWSPGELAAPLREPALLEPDDDLARELLAAWIARAGVGDVLEALARHEPSVIARTLRRVAAIEPLPWPAVARFAEADDPQITLAVLEAAGELDAAGWRWLLDLVAGTDADSRSLHVLDDPIRARAIARLRELSPNPAGTSLSYIDRDFLRAAERLVANAEAPPAEGALAIREGRWWGLRVAAERGTWLELARSIYPDVARAELIIHESGDDPWIASYRRGRQAYLLIYDRARLPGDSGLEADHARFTASAAGAEIRVDREGELSPRR